LVSEEAGGDEIIAEDKSGTGAQEGLGTTENAETKRILMRIHRSDELNVAADLSLAQYGTITSPETMSALRHPPTTRAHRS